MLLYYPFHGPESEWKVIASGNGRKQVTASRACRRAAFAILIPSSNWSFSSSAVLRPHWITTPSLSAQIYQACKNPLQQVVFQWAALNTPLFWPLQNGPVKTVQGSIQDLLPAKLREGMSWMIRMLLLVFLTVFDLPSQQNSSFRLRQSVRALATHWVASVRSSALCYLDTIMKSICCTRSNPNIQKGLTAVSSGLWDWVRKILVCWIDWSCRSDARGKPVPHFEEWKRIEKKHWWSWKQEKQKLVIVLPFQKYVWKCLER